MDQPKQIQISGFEVSPKTHKASSLWKRKKRLKNALDPKRNIINKQTDLGEFLLISIFNRFGLITLIKAT
jgi:hypothetical protein